MRDVAVPPGERFELVVASGFELFGKHSGEKPFSGSVWACGTLRLMCDDITEAENTAHLKRRDLNRGAGATIASLLMGCGSRSGPSESPSTPAPETAALHSPTPMPAGRATVDSGVTPATTHRNVTIKTPDGDAEGFFVVPSDGGPHPAVIIWPDVAGLRDAFESMATRLATSGYAVLAVNHYYRSSKLPVLAAFAEWQTPEGRAKIEPMRKALTPAAISSDAIAFVSWLDQQPEVDTARKIGTTGYCMGGPFTFRTAAAVAERIGAIGSFHGGGLVTEDGDSPHTLLPKMNAAALICIAQNDHERDPQAKTTLEQAAANAGRHAEIEVYPAQHGWCVTDSPVYDETQAERAWERLLTTFDANL